MYVQCFESVSDWGCVRVCVSTPNQVSKYFGFGLTTRPESFTTGRRLGCAWHGTAVGPGVGDTWSRPKEHGGACERCAEPR